ncbi:MAG: type I secretion system permease/ATPase [Candidatus Adiutrix sp.]|jgi:subfamily B ATP-binding cassette protein HlyB/CyaB|nr:type I secretion system permease/ATPase [Candidatus Adiutrix sp.]
MAEEPGGSGEGSGGETPDAGLLGLVLIARFHQIPVTPEGLRHQFAPAVKNLGAEARFGDQEILLAAKSLGLRAKVRTLKLENLDNAILPALAKDREGRYFILVQSFSPGGAPSAIAREATAEDGDGELQYLIHQLEPQPGPKKMTAAELSEIWDGQAILMSPRRSPFFGLQREFNLKWFIPSLIKYRRLFGEVLLASFLIQLFGLVTPLFFQVVMDKVLVHRALTTLDVLAIGFLAASFFEVILNALRNYLFSHTTTRVDVELGARLFNHLTALPLAWFQARQAGQSVARVRELDSLRNFITSTALTLVIDLGFTFVYFGVMYFYSPTLTLIVLASLPFYVGLSVFITPILKHRLDKKFQHGAANQSFLVEAVTGVETIKSLALEPQMQKRWENMLASYVTAGFRAQNLGQMAGQVASFIQKLSTLLIIWFGAHQVMEGELTVGQLVAFNMIAGRVSGPILKLTQLWQDFQQAGISLKRLGDILNTPREPGMDPGRGSLPTLRGEVKFEQVRFRYRPDGPTVLEDLSLDIHQGEIIGLVGRSGSGKSTLAKLIQRMYVPESGRVLVDGVDLALVDTAWLRKSIGVVLQENVLFSGTVRENIALSDPGMAMERVVEAARLAGAHGFILELPEGYDTQVGERGGSLSGGQRQRLAMARVLTGNPRILIFDEATSALDYESERVIQDNMSAICRGRTVFIIAHRLSAVRPASRIFVLDQGRLVESGTPKALMEKKGFFYQMVMNQNQMSAPRPAPAPVPAVRKEPVQ